MEGETSEETATGLNVLVDWLYCFPPLFLNIFTEVYMQLLYSALLLRVVTSLKR